MNLSSDVFVRDQFGALLLFFFLRCSCRTWKEGYERNSTYLRICFLCRAKLKVKIGMIWSLWGVIEKVVCLEVIMVWRIKWEICARGLVGIRLLSFQTVLLQLWYVASLAGVGFTYMWCQDVWQFTYCSMLIVFVWQSSLETQRCEDAVSTASSGYGSDVKTIKAVCEQMKVSYRNPCSLSQWYRPLLSCVL